MLILDDKFDTPDGEFFNEELSVYKSGKAHIIVLKKEHFTRTKVDFTNSELPSYYLNLTLASLYNKETHQPINYKEVLSFSSANRSLIYQEITAETSFKKAESYNTSQTYYKKEGDEYVEVITFDQLKQTTNLFYKTNTQHQEHYFGDKKESFAVPVFLNQNVNGDYIIIQYSEPYVFKTNIENYCISFQGVDYQTQAKFNDVCVTLDTSTNGEF